MAYCFTKPGLFHKIEKVNLITTYKDAEKDLGYYEIFRSRIIAERDDVYETIKVNEQLHDMDMFSMLRRIYGSTLYHAWCGFNNFHPTEDGLWHCLDWYFQTPDICTKRSFVIIFRVLYSVT